MRRLAAESKNIIWDEWFMHFDNLFWTVTTILATATGGLLLYLLQSACTESRTNSYLALFGFLLTILSVHFAASFRHHRQIIHRKLPKGYRNIMTERCPIFTQWLGFILIFTILGIFFLSILYEYSKSVLASSLILWIGFIGVLFNMFLWCATKDEGTIDHPYRKIECIFSFFVGIILALLISIISAINFA